MQIVTNRPMHSLKFTHWEEFPLLQPPNDGEESVLQGNAYHAPRPLPWSAR